MIRRGRGDARNASPGTSCHRCLFMSSSEGKAGTQPLRALVCVLCLAQALNRPVVQDNQNSAVAALAVAPCQVPCVARRTEQQAEPRGRNQNRFVLVAPEPRLGLSWPEERQKLTQEATCLHGIREGRDCSRAQRGVRHSRVNSILSFLRPRAMQQKKQNVCRLKLLEFHVDQCWAARPRR